MTVARAWVLLHGTPLDPEVWAELTPILDKEQPVFCPIVTPRPEDRLPQQAIARRIAAELATVADRWDVVGHSFGGQVAIELALNAPDRVATLSLICSRDTPFPAFAQTATDLRRGDPIDVESALHRWFVAGEQQSGARLVSYAREQLANADRFAWASALDGIAVYDRALTVHEIQVPATLICAELDPVSDPTAMTALAERLPNSELHVLAGAAHLSPLLHPADLAARLTRPLP